MKSRNSLTNHNQVHGYKMRSRTTFDWIRSGRIPTITSGDVKQISVSCWLLLFFLLCREPFQHFNQNHFEYHFPHGCHWTLDILIHSHLFEKWKKKSHITMICVMIKFGNNFFLNYFIQFPGDSVQQWTEYLLFGFVESNLRYFVWKREQ